MKKNRNPKIAIVYDKVNTQYGGAEWVLLALHQAFPDAPLFTSIYDRKKAAWASPFKVITSFLQNIPIKNHVFLVWLFPLAFESLNLQKYDVVISVTSGEAKGVLTKPQQLHISYVLTPPRYLYTHTQSYLQRSALLRAPLISGLSQMLLSYLRWWDSAAAHRADKHVALSTVVQKRISDLYNLESDIIYPPLPPQIKVLDNKNSRKAFPPFLLSLSRLVAYKRIDLSMSATLQTQKTLVVAGQGEERKRLISQAGKKARVRTTQSLNAFIAEHTKDPGFILFVGPVTNAERMMLLKSADALLMPGLEDFGITALEAASVGTPSILHKDSGVSEILTHKQSALHIAEEETAAVVQAIKQLSSTRFSATTLRNQAEKCSTQVFTRKFREYVYDSIIQLEHN